MFDNMKIGARLFGMAGVLAALMAFVGLLGLRSLQGSTETLRTSLATATSITSIVDEGRDSQVELKKQVQEWKDLLIRGRSKTDFDKHFAAFSKQEARCRASLRAARQPACTRPYRGRHQRAVARSRRPRRQVSRGAQAL